MAQVVGLDIGTRTVAGAVFTGAAKRFRLTDFFVEEIPGLEQAAGAGEEIVPPPSVSEIVSKLLTARGLGAVDVVAAIDSKDAILREIAVPFLKDEHIRKTIQSEAENHFQTFDIDEAVLEYHKVDEVGDKSRVLLAAVKNNTIRDRLEVLKQAGVDPIALDLDAAALFNAFARTPTYDPNRSTLLIDMGATSTKVLLIEKGSLRKIRAVRMDSYLARTGKLLPQPAAVGAAAGGPAIPGPESYSIEARFAEIENALRRLDPVDEGELALHEEPIAILTDEEFDLVRQAPEGAPGGAGKGEPPSPAPGMAGGKKANGATAPPREFSYADYLDRLGIEIQRTFAAASIQAGVDLICLTGGMSQREEARRYFSEQFDVETIQLDFGDSFPSDLAPEVQGEVGRVGAVAVGLALKELGGDRIGFDFRKKEFRFERKFERVKFPLIAVGALTCFVFMHCFFILWHQYQFHSHKSQEIRKREQEMFLNFFDKPSTNNRLAPQAEQEKKAWQNFLGVGGGSIPLFIPVIDAIEELSRGFQDSGAQDSRLELIDLRLKTRPLKGKVVHEATSTLTILSGDTSLGLRIEKAFGKPKGIFSASVGETKRGSNLSLNVTLTPQERYLSEMKR